MIEYNVSDGLCFLQLNNPPHNTLSLDLLSDLRSSLGRAGGDESVTWIVMCGKESNFSTGADIHLFEAVSGHQEACEVSRRFQEAFAEVEASEKPVAVFLTGRVMGCGIELAAACHYRVCAPDAVFCMPGVNLATMPCGGGTQRLPRLVGPAMALDMLLTAGEVTSAEAKKAGLVDAICGPGEFESHLRAVFSSGTQLRNTIQITDKTSDAAGTEMALAIAEGRIGATRPEVVSPRKITDSVRAAVERSPEEGFACERESFASCMSTPAARNKIYLLLATRKAGVIHSLATVTPRPVTTIGVIGMGTVGAEVSRAIAEHGFRVTIFDEHQETLTAAIEWIGESLEKHVSAGQMTRAAAARIRGRIVDINRWDRLAEADIIIEALHEDATLKRNAVEKIESVCGEDVTIATNTSILPLDDLASVMSHGKRLIGMHFFTPAHHTPLVEIIRLSGTGTGVVAGAVHFAQSIGKTPVLVENRPGYIVSRMLVPYMKEAFRLLEEGADPRVIDGVIEGFGFPKGPLAMADAVGLDALIRADRELRNTYDHWELPSPIAMGFLDAGYSGVKSGAGVYKYRKGNPKPYDHGAAADIIRAVREGGTAPRRNIESPEIIQRLLLRMINEAFAILGEKIVQQESDIDVASVMAGGFPDFHGGVLRYARSLGPLNIASRLSKFAQGFGRRYTPCASLKNWKEN